MGAGWKHRQGSLTDIDRLAYQSQLGGVHAALKCAAALSAIVLVLATRSTWTAGFTILSMGILTVFIGKVPLYAYLRLLLTPSAFILVSAVVLLFDYTAAPVGMLKLPFLGGYLCITQAAQSNTVQLVLSAMAAVSCLYALSLSTPMGELIGVMRRARLPELVIELMYLIYRYIFILSHTLSQLKFAADGRLGFATRRASLRSIGFIMSALLQCSFRRASISFDAMESRCYEGAIRFIRHKSPLCTIHLLYTAGWFCLAGLMAVLEMGVL